MHFWLDCDPTFLYKNYLLCWTIHFIKIYNIFRHVFMIMVIRKNRWKVLSNGLKSLKTERFSAIGILVFCWCSKIFLNIRIDIMLYGVFPLIGGIYFYLDIVHVCFLSLTKMSAIFQIHIKIPIFSSLL